MFPNVHIITLIMRAHSHTSSLCGLLKATELSDCVQCERAGASVRCTVHCSARGELSGHNTLTSHVTSAQITQMQSLPVVSKSLIFWAYIYVLIRKVRKYFKVLREVLKF